MPSPTTRIRPTLTPSPSGPASTEVVSSPTPTSNAEPNLPRIRPDNLSGLAPLLTLDEDLGPVTSIAFSPDSAALAAGFADGAIRVWEVPDGRLLHTLQVHEAAVRDLAFIPGQPRLVSAAEEEFVFVWNTTTGLLEDVLDTSLVGKALAVSVSAEGTLIAIGGSRCRILLRHADTGFLRRSLHQPECRINQGGLVNTWGLDFTPDGGGLVSGEGRPGSGVGSIQLWDVEEYAPPALIWGYSIRVGDLCVSPVDQMFAVVLTGGSEILILELPEGNLLHTLAGHEGRINSVAFSPDGQLVASGGRDATLRLWSPQDGELLGNFENQSAAILSLAFSPDGSLIATGAEDDVIHVWGLEPE